ncbi:MAG: hypothetical protein BGO49_17875 [Planctomycetales bacterium 71-10]|nr:MAG: hypothetical protein BGO49_17875 [Planctomycetales bacterium 71-10]
MTMAITDGPISDEALQKIRDCARGALDDLGPEVAAEGPAGIVAAIDDIMDQVQQDPGRVAEEEGADPMVYFGALWGEQLVAALGWEWANVDLGLGDPVIGVVSPDRSLAIYPFHFLVNRLNDPGLDVTVALAFNMLVDKAIPPMPPGGYADVMVGVRRIVPRR